MRRVLLILGISPAFGEACDAYNVRMTAPTNNGGADVLRILLAILIPPLGVFLQVGIGLHFWINLILTLLGYVPGIIHAVWVIVTK